MLKIASVILVSIVVCIGLIIMLRGKSKYTFLVLSVPIVLPSAILIYLIAQQKTITGVITASQPFFSESTIWAISQFISLGVPIFSYVLLSVIGNSFVLSAFLRLVVGWLSINFALMVHLILFDYTKSDSGLMISIVIGFLTGYLFHKISLHMFQKVVVSMG